MKKIYLVRHAKSSWSNHTLPDIDRPLNERGYANAHDMAEFLMRTGHKADVFLSSTAIRALSTALIFSRKGLINEEKIQLVPSLYETTAQEYLSVINKQDDRFSSLFLFAHNPTISEVFNLLGSGMEEELTTCNVGIVEFSVEFWAEVNSGVGKKAGVFTPATLPAM